MKGGSANLHTAEMLHESHGFSRLFACSEDAIVGLRFGVWSEDCLISGNLSQFRISHIKFVRPILHCTSAEMMHTIKYLYLNMSDIFI